MLSDSRYLLTEDAILSSYANCLCLGGYRVKEVNVPFLSSICSVSEDTIKVCGSSLSYIIVCENIQELIKVRELKITY